MNNYSEREPVVSGRASSGMRRRIKLSIMGASLAIYVPGGVVRASHDDSNDGLREVGDVKRAEHGFRIVFLQVCMIYFGNGA